MNRRNWLWISLAALPLIAAGALAASTWGTRSTLPQAPQIESATIEETCSTPDCCKDCPPDCPPEACPLCHQ